MAKKLTPNYDPVRVTNTHWSVHESFIGHWLIRGDIEKQSEMVYKRIKDDPFLKEHKTGHTYTAHK